jgi:type I restriction enzyme S subunit
MKLPDTWVDARLGDVLTRVDAKIDPQTSHSESHFYVGLEQIESHTGRLLRATAEVTEAIDILSIKTVFKKGDILYGKLRPNLNKVLVATQDGICSTDIWALRASEELLPDFALRYLRSPATYVRAAQLATGANLPRLSAEAFDRIPIPIPTIPEQQRIVDVLRQADASVEVKEFRRRHLDQVIKAALDQLVLGCGDREWVKLGSMVETRYGTSVSADATVESGVPVLRIPNVMGGEVDTSDIKYVELTKAELGRLSLTTNDVLIVRSNGNPDYVGRSAPITEDVCQSVIVYASYLIRLRTDSARLLPEYLSAFLNSAYGRAAMRNAIRTTAGQSNLSGENLAKVRLPVPDLTEQEQFRRLWHQVKEIRSLVTRSEDEVLVLRAALSIYALSGDLTAQWREQNATTIAEAVHSRNENLREQGTKIFLSAKFVAATTMHADLTVRPARHWLLSELSEFQRQVLAAFTTYCQASGEPLLVEDPDLFARFCDDETVTECLQVFGTSHGNRIRRTLSQLAALGLIAKVTLPKVDPKSGERDYLKAFRPLRSEEFTRMADVQALRKALSADVNQLHYYFQVQLNYGTSEGAGAGGMFQVISLEDDEAKNYTHLVDQGRHYASLDDLKGDLASVLNVATVQIDLEAM